MRSAHKPIVDVRREETGYVDNYLSFARTLRTWFVAYGIGAPVLIVKYPRLKARA